MRRVELDGMYRSLGDDQWDFFCQTPLADLNGDGTDDLVATGAYDTLSQCGVLRA